MNFQWNSPGPGGHAGGRSQPMPHWPNQEQYNTDSMPASHFMFQDPGPSQTNWNTGVPYNQWCPPTSQEQMNWTCSTYPTNPYNQVPSGNFVSNVYCNSGYTHQNKANYGENLTGLYNDTKRNDNFNYQATTNTFMSGQGNNYRMLENNLLSNCQESSKTCGNQNASENFPYWHSISNGSQTMSYLTQPIYSNHMCDNRPTLNLKMETSDMDSNHPQTDMIHPCDEKHDVTLHRQVPKSETANPTFSNPSSDYFLSTLSHDNASSSMAPDHKDIKSQNLLNSLCPLNPHKAINSTLISSKNIDKVNSSLMSAKFNETVNSSLMSAKFNTSANSALTLAKFSDTVKSSLSSAKFNDTVNLSLTPAKFNSSLNTPLTPAKFNSSLNSPLTPAKFNSSLNSPLTPAKFNSSLNSPLTPAKFNSSLNSPLTPAKFNSTLNSPVTPAKFNSAVNTPLTPVKFNSTLHSPLTPVKLNGTVNSSLAPAKFNGTVNSSLASAKFNCTSNSSLAPAKFNGIVNSPLTSGNFNGAINSSMAPGNFNGMVNSSLSQAKLNDTVNPSLTPAKFNCTVNPSSVKFNDTIDPSLTQGKFNGALNSSLTTPKFEDPVKSSLICGQYNNSLNSSSAIVEHNDTNARSKGNFRFVNNTSNEPVMTTVFEKDGLSTEDLQKKISCLQNKILAKSAEFENAKKLMEECSYEKFNALMYHLIRGIKILEVELERIECEVKKKTLGLNVPMYIGLDECGPRDKKESGLPNHTNMTLKSLKQHLDRMKDQISQHLNLATKSDSTFEIGRSVNKKCEDQPGSVVAPKSSSVKQARRAVLKYLLKLSGKIENCFSELRNVKRILKDDPTDKNIIRILHKVGLHINQSRLSLKEKKKLCAKSNIRLRSLTIKSTGTNILQTLESDMYHLRRFYTALSHIARHLGTVEKSPGQAESAGEEGSQAASHIPTDSFPDPDAEDTQDTDVDILNSLQSNTQPESGSSGSDGQSMKNTRNTVKSHPGYSASKSVRFMSLERRFWDKLMEISYNIRAKILALRQAERAYKNGVEGSLAELRSVCGIPCNNFKRDFKLLARWKKKYNFTRHIPTYILQSYPEQERRSRDKITQKSVRKNLATFMSLCYSTRVSIGTDASSLNDSRADSTNNDVVKEEARFSKRLPVLKRKIQMCQFELSKLQQAMSVDVQNKKGLDSVIKIEAKVKEIECEMEKEIISKQKNHDILSINDDTQRFKLNNDECKDIHLLRGYLQNLKSALSQIKSTQRISPSNSNTELSHTVDSQKQKDLPLPTHVQELPADLANFLSEEASGWI